MPLKTKIDPLSKDDLIRVHDASIQILEKTGVVFQSEEALKIFREHGARIEGRTVYIGKKMAESALMRCPAKFEFTARNDNRSVQIGERFVVQPNAGPTDVQDLDRGRRPATLQDYINFQKMSQASEVTDIAGGLPVVPQDVDLDELHLRLMYESIRHSDKPLISSCLHGEQARQVLQMVALAFGGGDIFKEHVLGVSINPLSPMAYGPEAIETLLVYAQHNQPVFILPCIMAGISGPINLLGTVVQQNAEIIAGTVLAQLANPGTPVVYSPSSTVGDLKTGEYITGSPEAFLINSANLQLAKDIYKMPTRIMCGMTDSDEIDCQAGYETEQNLMMGMLTGANILVNCLGTLDSLMCTSYEKFIIDEELLKRFYRITDGLDASEESMSLDIIQEVTRSGGNYLTHESTLRYCRYHWRPTVSFRGRHKRIMKGGGSEDLVAVANKRFKEVLAEQPESIIDSSLDRELLRFMDRIKKSNTS